MKRACCLFVSLVPLGLLAAPAHPVGLPEIPPRQLFSFVVLGDNRGDDSGEQPPAFFQVLDEVGREAPAFVLDTGDMIYGHNPDEATVREQWRIYRQAVSHLGAPMFHVPGNHDLWDEPSARIYQELWGPTYYTFDYGNSRFIGLDTETAQSQISAEQFQWLEQTLHDCTQTNVFVFLHSPLFPVDGAIGSSLDKYPAKRDQLHQLFTRYRALIRGVFAGHEHLFDFREIDGVPYYISGGGGAPLYSAPELGGFHHFLVVRVRDGQVKVELKKVCPPHGELLKPRPIAPQELLESWDEGLFWYAWDRTATIELTPGRASHGRRGLRFNFDLAQYSWPVLAVASQAPWDFRESRSLKMDVYVPETLHGPLSLVASLEGIEKHEAPPVELKPGWNKVTTALEAPWLPSSERGAIHSLEWRLSAKDHRSRGYLVFDHLRAERRTPENKSAAELLESWERPLLWRFFDETVSAEMRGPGHSREKTGLRLHVDFSEYNRPVLFTRLNPPWNMTKVKALQLEMRLPDSLPNDLVIVLGFRAKEVEVQAPPLALHAGINQLRFDLEGGWLPSATRAAAELASFTVTSTNRTFRGELDFETLRAATNSPP